MNYCINCKHNERELWCKAPSNGISPVTGKPNPAFASVNRGTSVLAKCGPDGLNFEQKPPPPMYFFDEDLRSHIEKTVSVSGFIHVIYQYFGRKP